MHITYALRAQKKAELEKALPEAPDSKESKTVSAIEKYVTAQGAILEKDKKKDVKTFFTLQEFSRWYQGLSDGEKRKWNVKYYIGLGTSSSKEGKEYFGTILKSDCVFLLFAVFQCLLHVPVCLIQNRALATYSKPRAAQVGHALLQRSRR